MGLTLTRRRVLCRVRPRSGGGDIHSARDFRYSVVSEVIMKSLSSAFILAVLVSFSTAIPAASATPEDELILKARAFLSALEKNDFQAAAEDFDGTMLKLSGPDKLAAFWKEAPVQFSPFRRQTAARRDTLGAYDIVLVTCKFEKQTLDARVVFDKDKKIAGFQFIPSLPPARYESPSYADPARFAESDATVGSGEWALPGTLTAPTGEGPFPALVLVHGSGPNDRDEAIGPNKPFKDLAWGLASRGIAVLRYDKRSRVYGAKIVTDPRLPFLTVKEETIDDAVEAVRLLKKTSRIDGRRIFVLGHSLGGMLIPRIALAAKDLGPAGFISMAGLTRTLEDTMLQQMTYLYGLDGQISAGEAQQNEALKAQIAQVKAFKDSDRGAAKPMIFNAPPAYWLDLRGYYPPETAKSMDRPFLILQGARDYQVTVEDFDNWKKALEGRPGVVFRLYPKCNHLFFEAEGIPSPMEYQLKHGSVATQVIDDIADFILKN
jgi:dienelactone hydrolase